MSKWIAGLAGVVVVALAVGLWAFEPWTKFTSSTVDEALPTTSSTGAPSAAPDQVDAATDVPAVRTESDPGRRDRNRAEKDGGRPDTKKVEPAPAPAPAPSATPEPAPDVVELASGPFQDAEYDTNGIAKIIKLADGSRFVRLEGFSTSDGPDVFVGLSNSPSGGAWGSYDDIRYVQLGGLKATNGNQNYEIPADVDLSGFQSVVIWCDRFDVAFGTAPVSL